MKKSLLILACAAIAGCGYEHHPDVLAATRDPSFVEWLRQNDLVMSSAAPGYECSIIYVRKLVKDEGAK